MAGDLSLTMPLGMVGSLVAICLTLMLAPRMMRQNGNPTIAAFDNGKWKSRTASTTSSYWWLLLAALTWYTFTILIVPNPYLDEVFHVPQAQRYCQGKWREWDDKITTPPGLYLVSSLGLRYIEPSRRIFREILDWLTGRQDGVDIMDVCTTPVLRMVNTGAIVIIGFLATQIRHRIEVSSPPSTVKHLRPTGVCVVSNYSLHSGVNVALMPVLFFFGGLYYTDVLSALTVLWSFDVHLQRINDNKAIWTSLKLVFLGSMSLLMRQTNIFWIVVYMGGREFVALVKKNRINQVFVDPAREFTSVSRIVDHFWPRYASGDINDPTLDRMTLDDVFFTTVSIAVAAGYLVVRRPTLVITELWPYLLVMGLFVTFVVVNDGVVLGDKSNHVATLHLAQMLYIWPVFVFFSWPLMVPVVLSALGKFRKRPVRGEKAATSGMADASSPTASAQSNKPTSRLVKALRATIEGRLYVVPVIGLAIAASVMIVKHNTIVHPFTLADNRHYMFYVARRTILLPVQYRVQLVFVYLLGAVLSIGALSPTLGKVIGRHVRFNRGAVFMNRPFSDPDMLRDDDDSKSAVDLSPLPPLPPPIDFSKAPSKILVADLEQEAAPEQPTWLSNVLLWVLATSLSLITGPLVEPRYFILPWIFWRLELPAWTRTQQLSFLGSVPGSRKILAFGRTKDLRLYVETLWFALVNIVVSAIFLFKPFKWRAEDGSLLDEGRDQRFMW